MEYYRTICLSEGSGPQGLGGRARVRAGGLSDSLFESFEEEMLIGGFVYGISVCLWNGVVCHWSRSVGD